MTTCLIVDDHAGFRELARAMLESDGFNVVGEAADGVSALAAVAREHPDVVLLDVQLPDIDGFEVLARLRHEAVPGDVPDVVLVSSRDANVYGERIWNSGARGFIHKVDLSSAALHEAISR